MKDDRTCRRAERGRFITNSIQTISTHPGDSVTSLIPKYLLLLSAANICFLLKICSRDAFTDLLHPW